MPCVQWSLAYCNCHMIWQWIVESWWYAGLVSLGPNDSTLWGLLGIGRIPGPGGIFPNQVQLVLLRWRSLGPSFAVPLLHWKPPSAPLLLWASSFGACVSVPVHLYKNGPRLQELSWKKSRDSPSTAEISFFKTSHENRLLFVPKRFLDSGTWCQSPLHHQHLPNQSGKAQHFVNHRCLP